MILIYGMKRIKKRLETTLLLVSLGVLVITCIIEIIYKIKQQ
jgi:hypothetical protein